MEKRVCIAHYNTPELTRATILSLWKNTPDAKVTVFDNSDTRPFVPMPGVDILDNTKGQLIDFNELLARYPNKVPTTNNWGSAKHCYTIQKLWEYYPDGFVLMDSDVLITRDISEFWDSSFAFIGTVYCDPKRPHKRIPRLYPFLCWINVPMCTAAGVHYYDDNRNWYLCPGNNGLYDTGASFYEDCCTSCLPNKRVLINKYLIHFGNASHSKQGMWYTWLEEHKNLYE